MERAGRGRYKTRRDGKGWGATGGAVLVYKGQEGRDERHEGTRFNVKGLRELGGYDGTAQDVTTGRDGTGRDRMRLDITGGTVPDGRRRDEAGKH